MADPKRINALANDSAPVPTDVVAIDSTTGGTTRSTTILSLVNSARPVAEKAEAEAGVNNDKSMSPLRTLQSILVNGISSLWSQSGAGAVVRNVDNKLKEAVSVLDFGAVGDGVADDTAAFVAMIDYLNSRTNGVHGGGLGHVPQGRYRITGVLPYLKTNVGIFGDGPQASLLDFAGATDCFLFGDAASPTRGQTLGGMYLGAQGKTGGTMVKLRNVFNAKLSRIQSEANWIGIDVGPRCNGTILEDLFFSATQGTTPIALKFVAGASNADRSDVLTIRNVILTGQWSNATLFQWDGAAYTVDVHGLRLLHANIGIEVLNTAASASWYPSFLNAHNIQAEGFKTRAVWVKAGSGFKITGSDLNNLTAGDPSQGAADLAAVHFEPDLSQSYTRSVQISDTRIGGSQREGLVIDCRDVSLANVIFYTTSYSGAGNYPVIRCGANAQDVQLANIKGEEFGGAARASYLIQLDAGATRVQGVNLDCAFCQTGNILDNSGNTTNVFSNIIRRTGLPTQTHNGKWANRASVTGGQVENRAHNESTDGVATAAWVLSTSVPNAFRQGLVHNSGGSPYYIVNGGSAITIEYNDVDTSIWRNNAGAEKARLDAAGFKLLNGRAYMIGTVQVVGARDAGWTAMTGTGSKAALAAAPAGIASASYTQSELQTALNRLAAMEARLRSLDAALFAHGLIGA